MGILDIVRGLFLKASNEPLTDKRISECPSCHKALNKVPGSKTKCPHCDQFMFIRTKPQTNERIVVTENEAQRIDEDWSMLNGTHDNYIKEREYKNKTIIQKWNYLKKQSSMHIENKDYGLFRNTKLTMAELIVQNEQLKDALSLYLEVCFLDLNGVYNCGSAKDDLKYFKKIRPFDRHSSYLADGIIARMIELIKELSLPQDEVMKIFMEFNEDVYVTLRTPKSPGKCWPTLEKKLWPKNLKNTAKAQDSCAVEFIEIKKSGQKGKQAFLDSTGTACSIEEAVQDYFCNLGYRVIRGEVRFWQAMFGLAFWEEIFEGTDTPSIFNDIPLDLFSGDQFYVARKDKIEKKMSFLSNTNIYDFISSQLRKHENTDTRIIFEGGHQDDYHDVLKSEDVSDFLKIVSPLVFSKIVHRIATNPNEHRAGAPDYNIWKGSDVTFIEVKGLHEAVRESQVSWLAWMHSEGMPVKIIRVKGVTKT